jgi:hypothetical protein
MLAFLNESSEPPNAMNLPGISPFLPSWKVNHTFLSFLHLSSSSVPTIPYFTSLSIPLSRRFRARTPTLTPFIPSSQPQPLLRAQLQLALQLLAWILAMYEIAEAAAHTAFTGIQPAARLAEIRHGGQLAVDRACSVPARVKRFAGCGSRVFVFEARVDVAD